MRVLVACEFSGIVRDAFRTRGHDAWSCDLLPCEADPQWHIQGNVLEILEDGWDLMIGHPPCTDLAVSGAAWFKKKGLPRIQAAVDFFNALLWAPIKRICLENPVSLASRFIRPPDQIVHPWQFGHMEQKAICLWLVGLPCLKGTKNVHDEMLRLPKAQRERLHYLPPSKYRWKLRSQTFPSVANAFAEQWGVLDRRMVA